MTKEVDDLIKTIPEMAEDILLWAMNPKFIEALRHERARLDRSTYRMCPWGTCEIAVDPVDNTIVSTIGLVGCPCDFFPGWRSSYYEGLPKPGFAVKPYGRHGGRIARKRRITAEHQRWLESLDWNPKPYVTPS